MTAIRIYTRPPIAGATKSRLAVSIGDHQAAMLHRAFLEDTILHARAVPGAVVSLDVTEDHPRLRALAETHGLSIQLQREGDLGARMAASIANALIGHVRVLLVGSDAPLLGPSDLRTAEAALASAEPFDAVFAPTPDGGYALLGALRPLALPDVRWSTRFALRDSEQSLDRQGLRHRRLSPTFDVDRPEDLRLLRAALSVEPGLAPATARALSSMRMHL